MADVTIKHLGEFEFYQGPHMKEGIHFCYAGKGLGVTAWGMNVIELAPRCTTYPEHDHMSDGQEEVYVVLKGTVRLHAGDLEQRLDAGSFVRVPPHQKRAFFTDEEGATLLALGATPGKAYAMR
jgi:quercetin dioxygenase-like cupin family protein